MVLAKEKIKEDERLYNEERKGGDVRTYCGGECADGAGVSLGRRKRRGRWRRRENAAGLRSDYTLAAAQRQVKVRRAGQCEDKE